MANRREAEDDFSCIPETPSPVFTSRAISRQKKSFLGGCRQPFEKNSVRNVISVSSTDSSPAINPNSVSTSPGFSKVSNHQSLAPSSRLESDACFVPETANKERTMLGQGSKYSLGRQALKRNSALNNRASVQKEHPCTGSHASSDSGTGKKCNIVPRTIKSNMNETGTSLGASSDMNFVNGTHAGADSKMRLGCLNKCAKEKTFHSSLSEGDLQCRSNLKDWGNGFVKSSSLLYADGKKQVDRKTNMKRKSDSNVITSPSKRLFMDWPSSSDSSEDEDLLFNRCLKRTSSAQSKDDYRSSVNRGVNSTHLPNSQGSKCAKSRVGTLGKRALISSTADFAQPSGIYSQIISSVPENYSTYAFASSPTTSPQACRRYLTSPIRSASSPSKAGTHSPPGSCAFMSNTSATNSVPLSPNAIRVYAKPVVSINQCRSPQFSRTRKNRPFIPPTQYSPEFLSARHHSLSKQDVASTNAAENSSTISDKKGTANLIESNSEKKSRPSRNRNIFKKDDNRREFMQQQQPHKVSVGNRTDEKSRENQDTIPISATGAAMANKFVVSPKKKIVRSSPTATVVPASNLEVIDRNSNLMYKPRRIAHSNAQSDRSPVKVQASHRSPVRTLSSQWMSPIRTSPSSSRSPEARNSTSRSSRVYPGHHDNPIHIDAMTPETKSALRCVQQLQDDENVARALQEELDREFAMSLQGSMEHNQSHRDSLPPNPAETQESPASSSSSFHLDRLSALQDRFMLPAQTHGIDFHQFREIGDLLGEQMIGGYERPRRRRGGRRARHPRHDPFSPGGNGQDYERLLNLGEMLGEVKSKGLSKSESCRLPIVSYKKPDTDTVEECNICMTDYEEGDSQKILPCFHSYHAACIDKWIMKNASCPVCRVDVKIE